MNRTANEQTLVDLLDQTEQARQWCNTDRYRIIEEWGKDSALLLRASSIIRRLNSGLDSGERLGEWIADMERRVEEWEMPIPCADQSPTAVVNA